MNVIQKSLAGISLVALLAGCSADVANQSPQAKSSEATTAEVHSDKAKTAADKKMDRELLSTVDIRLADGKVELSESQVSSGHLEFNVTNDTTEPLHMEIVKTDFEPTRISVKDGKVDRAQTGVEVLSELRTEPIKPGHQETLLETLEPGDYTIVVTSPGQATPVAYSTLTIQPQ
ncbi:hypothetical protein C7271_21105 [filamentous cyanobacterium CCP5]|nr:hypothetical protein C7271_21105 [filamentous cyanobacterium CCP5]